jgi:hypothetical protein
MNRGNIKNFCDGKNRKDNINGKKFAWYKEN